MKEIPYITYLDSNFFEKEGMLLSYMTDYFRSFNIAGIHNLIVLRVRILP